MTAWLLRGTSSLSRSFKSLVTTKSRIKSCSALLNGTDEAEFQPAVSCFATDVHEPELVQTVLDSEAVQGRLQQMHDRHQELSHTLASETSGISAKTMRSMHQEYARLEPVVQSRTALSEAFSEMGDLQQLLREGVDEKEGEEMEDLIRRELDGSQQRVAELQQEVVRHLLSEDQAHMDSRNAILEVRPGIGGDEASLFAMDLWTMYRRFAALQGWRFEVLHMALSEQGGCKHGSAVVAGAEAYGQLKWESGTHRVQRVPNTEASGRLHTSAATVVVLAEVDQVDVEVRDEDIRVDTFRASGAGGQHVNTTDSAVRLTHLPSGFVVSIQDERSQHKNKAKAMKVLRAQLFKAEEDRRQAASSESKMQISGTGDRSERIRTYNFPQGRITDHRVGHTEHGMERMLEGQLLQPFTSALVSHDRTQRLMQLVSMPKR